MSNLTLDGSTSFIGTEFIKLLATGSSNLATEEYVDDAIEQNGGGNGNVDLSNYYNQTETDNLLNNKLNVNNPQDITGNLRLDPTNGLSKIILNAVSPPNASDDFYCNGSGHFNGTLRVSLLTSDGDLNADGCNADTFNSNIITNDIVFKHNDVEYMRFNATNDTIDLSKELNLGSSTLKINSITTNGLNDMTFGVDTLGEFLRFNISDFTVRVPDNRSFLAQNIFTDIIKPVAFANDVVLNGGNSTNDAYEEYLRLDASDEKVNFSKNVDMNEDLIMKSTKVLYLDATSNLLRYITTRNDNGQDILELVNNKATNNQIRFTNNGSTSLIVDNSFLFSERQIQGNNGLKVDYIDTRTANANFDFRRNNVSYITLQSDRVDINQPLHLSDALTIDVADKLTMRPSLESGVNIFDIRNLHPVADNPMIRFRVGEGGGETIVCEMTNNAVSFQRNVIVGTAYELQTNAIDTVNDNDLVISRNNVQFMALDKFTEDVNGSPTEIEAIICSKQLRANGQIRVNNLQINQFSSGVQYADFRLENTNSVMRFYAGNGTSANIQMTNAGIELRRETTVGSIKTNTIDTTGDNDLTIRRNGTDVLNIFTYTPTNGPSIIVDAQSDCGISSSWLFANTFANRTGNTDTYFRGAISGGLTSGKVYMTYLHATETLDFDCDIDNTGRAVIGNIFDTTASDERLKTNIQDVKSNYCDCVKNVKIKTFEYKDEKYKNNDKYGFIAQELLKHLPKEFDNIVKETKPKKDEGEPYLSINYMKLSLVLWGALQEEIDKREHIESRLFELEDIVKELKGKKTTKPKAKAKSKTKAEK